MLRQLLALALTATLASAQGGTGVDAPISITGVVQPAGPSICAQIVTHRLECTNVSLISQNIDLTALEGKLVQIKAKPTPFSSAICPALEVVAVSPNPSLVLESCGTPALGCPMRFKLCPGGMSLGAFLLSTAPGFQPLGPEIGTFLLSPDFVVLAQTGPSAPCHQLDIAVPNSPNLVGENFWMQGLKIDIGPVGPVQLSNAICFDILPPFVPCAQPGC